MRVRQLFRYEQTSGLLMIAAMFLALAIANSPFAWIYNLVHHIPVHFRFGGLVIDEPLVRWINEGLMACFFLLVGFEIKRQFLEGHLSTLKRAALPAFAALGGMIFPAAIYISINGNDPLAIRGWAIPTATDVVLALGVLSLLGSRVPASLKVFLAALAIFDDIGIVLIIGLFYGEALSITPLIVAALALVGLVLLNFCCILRSPAYVALGLILWASMLEAGVEAALAGVLIALTVPLRVAGRRCSSPLRKMERHLHPWCVLVIVPLFAFFNAGIVFNGDASALLVGPVSLGVFGGLFLGKQIGVLCATWAAVRLGLGQLPAHVNWGQIYGAALLAGIGFTMSLFVASLAFSDTRLIEAAKIAVLVGSFLSTVVGLGVIYGTTDSSRRTQSLL